MVGFLVIGSGILLAGFILGLHGGDSCFRVDAGVFCVNLPERRVSLDCLIDQRLRDGWVIDFAVAVAAVADHVDDDVGTEGVAVVECHVADADDCVDVFRVHVEDGDRLAASEVSRETLGVLLTMVGGESDKIVDDDVNGAADGVSGEVSEVHGLGSDALSGKGGIAVDEQREDIFRGHLRRRDPAWHACGRW